MFEIITNNVPRLLADDSEGVTYKGTYYPLEDFTTTSGLDGKLDLWDGYIAETYFSGIILRFTRDTDHVIMGRYFVS